VIPNDLGYVTVPDGGYKLAPRKVRQPDAAFIAKERFTAFGEPLFQLAPDLAIEVVSPDEDILKKAREYLSAGTRLVWAIYPDEKIVYVFHPPRDGELWLQELGVEDTLDGEDVLPGFKLKVRDLFPV
jgi:Uma2 family endonuclease